jgi:hypothetical protein
MNPNQQLLSYPVLPDTSYPTQVAANEMAHHLIMTTK